MGALVRYMRWSWPFGSFGLKLCEGQPSPIYLISQEHVEEPSPFISKSILIYILETVEIVPDRYELFRVHCYRMLLPTEQVVLLQRW